MFFHTGAFAVLPEAVHSLTIEKREGDKESGGAGLAKGKVLNDDRANWRQAWAPFPGDLIYVWHGALHASTVAASLEASGFAIRS